MHPVPVALLALAAVLATLFLRWTRPGIHVYALGGNRVAARLAGVNVARTTILVYAVSGFCGSVGGLIATSRLMVGFPATGLGTRPSSLSQRPSSEASACSAALGTVPGAMLGAVLIATVSNGMNILNVSSYWQSLVIGLIILGGVAYDTQRRIRVARSSRVEDIHDIEPVLEWQQVVETYLP